MATILTQPKGSSAPIDIPQLLEDLLRLGIKLPDKTNEANLLSRLAGAARAIAGRMGEESPVKEDTTDTLFSLVRNGAGTRLPAERIALRNELAAAMGRSDSERKRLAAVTDEFCRNVCLHPRSDKR